MSKQLDSDEKGNIKDRASLLKDFRGVLVVQWPEKESMETILADAGLDPMKFIVDVNKPENRWYQALAKMDSHQLLKLVDAVREAFEHPVEEVEAIAAFEESRLKEAEMKLDAEVMEAFGSLFEHRDAIAESIKQLRDTEHANDAALATLKERLGMIYQSLDKLRSAQRPNVTPGGEAAQLNDIERRANMCIDALQLYMTLLGHTEPDDMSQIGVTNVPGSLRERASDVVVLLQAKAALRSSLIRLTKAGQSR
jgi:hypothetical protein